MADGHELVGGLVLVGQGCPRKTIERPAAGVLRVQRLVVLRKSLHARWQSVWQRSRDRTGGDERCGQPRSHASTRATIRRSFVEHPRPNRAMALLRWHVVSPGTIALQRGVSCLDAAMKPNIFMKAQIVTMGKTIALLLVSLLVAPPHGLAIGQVQYVENVREPASFSARKSDVCSSDLLKSLRWAKPSRSCSFLYWLHPPTAWLSAKFNMWKTCASQPVSASCKIRLPRRFVWIQTIGSESFAQPTICRQMLPASPVALPRLHMRRRILE